MDDVTIEGYVVEVGDLGMGLKGGKPGRGVTLEVGDREVQISGLSHSQCRALSKHFRKVVRVTVSATPEHK
jgi:hypothetical protein